VGSAPLSLSLSDEFVFVLGWSKVEPTFNGSVADSKVALGFIFGIGDSTDDGFFLLFWLGPVSFACSFGFISQTF
jgi:hypothetical protein